MRYLLSGVFVLSLALTSLPVIAQTTNTDLPTHEAHTLTIIPVSANHVDSDMIRNTWLTRVNDARAELDRDPYTLDPELTNTAQTWANYLRDNAITKWTHSRKASDGYRKTSSIVERFAKQGVDVQAGKFTESNGWGMYRCSADDCNDILVKSIRSTYSFFMSEAKKQWPHRKSIVSSSYTRLGVGIAVDPETKRYRLVMHVATDAHSK